MNDFYDELHMLVCSEPIWRPGIKHIIDDLEFLRRGSVIPYKGIGVGVGVIDPYHVLTLCAYRFAFLLKCRLPDNLHNRMVLGVQNDWTKAYVRDFLL